MTKKIIKMLVLLTSGALMFGTSACDDDDDDDDTLLVTFEDLTTGTEGYWKGDSTGKTATIGQWGTKDYKGTFTSNATSFSNVFSVSSYGTSWTGFGYSTLADTSVAGDYTNDMYVYNTSGAANSKTFAVAYSDNATFEFETSKNILSTMVCNSTYTYKVLRDGNSFSKVFADGDWYKVTFAGFDANGAKTGETDYYLADFRNGKNYICGNWEKVDLSVLGKVKKVVLSFASSDTSSYGINTPAYVCIDNVEYK